MSSLPDHWLVVALVVKGTSWLPPKEQVQVRLLAGVLVVASMVKGTSRGSAKAEFLVRVQVGALWPNSKRQRDPAVNRGYAGSTPAGHPLVPVQLDGTSTPPVKGRVRVRVPPLALARLPARPSGGDRGSEPRSSWLDTSTGCSKKPAMLDGPGTALVTRIKWVRVPPPALDLR